MAAPSRIAKAFTDQSVTATVAELDGAADDASAGGVSANAAAAAALAAAALAIETANTVTFDGAAAVRQARAPSWVDAAAKEDLLPTVPQATLDFYELVERLLVDLSLDGTVGKRIGVYRVDHNVSGVSSVKFADLDAGTLAAQFYLASGEPPSLVTITEESSSGVSGTAEIDWSQLTAGLSSFTTIPRALPLSERALTTRTLVAEASAEAEQASDDVATFEGRIEGAEAAAADTAADVVEVDSQLDLVSRERDALAHLLDATRGHGADVVVRQGAALPVPTAGQTIALSQGLDMQGSVRGAAVADVTVSNIVEGGQQATDDLPRLDGTKAVTPSDWVAVGDGTYRLVWAHEIGRDKGAVCLFEVDADGNSLGLLARKAAIGSVASVSNSYHVDYGAGSGPATSPVTITLNPQTAGGPYDPSQGDKLYRASFEPESVRLGARGRVFNIHTRRTGPENGGVLIEGGGTISGGSMDEPFVHGATVLEGPGVIEDTVVSRMVQPLDVGGRGAVPFVIALATAPGQRATFRRDIYLGRGKDVDAARAFLTHPNSNFEGTGLPGPLHSLVRYEDCAVLDCDGAVFGQGERIEIDGLYTQAVRVPIIVDADDVYCRRLVVRDQVETMRPKLPSGVSTGDWVVEESHVRGGAVRQLTAPTGVHLTVSRSVLDGTANKGAIAAPSGLSMRYTVIRTAAAAITMIVSGAVTETDWNLYVGPFRVQWNGTNYFSLADWRTALSNAGYPGVDANSVHIADPTAALSVADDGDARVAPAALSGTALSATGVGQTRPAARWPIYPTLADIRRGGLTPRLPAYHLAV